ncbi:hypothetical protein [Micromonospora sp. NBC_01813]|uniref:hypothetical protein n=1 Tax=Micromonospora sp. NBC_01813 TaxID=2975988 RepID=UPI002DD984E0|nr:hypothetical protein [Micromonospora sp. NBC_01813]WSA08642.1 hypothetical protein OG958_31455 [Micromonospora sp. NBC_01813]
MQLPRSVRHPAVVPLLLALLALLAWVPLPAVAPERPPTESAAASAPASAVPAADVAAQLVAREGVNRLAPVGPDGVTPATALPTPNISWPRRVGPDSLIPRPGYDRHGSRAPPTRPVATV